MTIGRIQLSHRSARALSMAPAIAWQTTMRPKASAQAAVISRLTRRKAGLDQYSRGTDSRAYCSVKGTHSRDRSAIAQRPPAARARP